MRVSQAASSGRATAGWIRPKVSRPMVRVARSAAGLQPGTNLMIPNQKNTMPRAIRVMVTPRFAIHEVRRASMGSRVAGRCMDQFNSLSVKLAEASLIDSRPPPRCARRRTRQGGQDTGIALVAGRPCGAAGNGGDSGALLRGRCQRRIGSSSPLDSLPPLERVGQHEVRDAPALPDPLDLVELPVDAEVDA